MRRMWKARLRKTKNRKKVSPRGTTPCTLQWTPLTSPFLAPPSKKRKLEDGADPSVKKTKTTGEDAGDDEDEDDAAEAPEDEDDEEEQEDDEPAVRHPPSDPFQAILTVGRSRRKSYRALRAKPLPLKPKTRRTRKRIEACQTNARCDSKWHRANQNAFERSSVSRRLLTMSISNCISISPPTALRSP